MSTYHEVKKLGLKRAEELIRAHPDWNIDRIAKTCANEGTTVYRSDVAKLRQKLRQELAEAERRKPLTAPVALIADKHKADVKEAVKKFGDVHGGVVLDNEKEMESHGYKGPRMLLKVPEPADLQKLMPPPPMPTAPNLKTVEEAFKSVPPEPARAAVVDVKPEKTPPRAPKDWAKLHAEAMTRPGAHKGARNVEAMKIRRDWLNELLEVNPSAHPQEIQGNMITLFGMATSPEYIYETCRLAREVHGLPTIPRSNRSKAADAQPDEPKEPEQMTEPIKPTEPADDGTRVLAWMQPGSQSTQPTQRFELTTKERVGDRVFELVVGGVKKDSIRVFRPAPFKLSFSVEIG